MMKTDTLLAAMLAALILGSCAHGSASESIPPAGPESAGPVSPETAVGDRPDLGASREEGEGSEGEFRAIDAAIEAAIRRGVTPGAVVVVGGRDGVVYMRGFGAVDWGAGAAAAGDSTVYDLASLTKVVGTTTAVMLLVERGLMALDDPLSRYLSAWPQGGWRDRVTIRRLLTHSAGLAPFVRFWHPSAGALRGHDAVVEAIADLPASYPPGERVTYSDLGFILLGAAVAEVTGASLDRFLEREVWAPLDMGDTGFNPLDRLSPGRIAPTEVDTVFRGTHVHGVVHDENAYAMGGVAGHAGLFSTARDLARYATELLCALDEGLDTALPIGRATATTFATRAAGLGRALGWDAWPGSGGIGRALSPRAFGHTGFTGTSLWLDPERDLFVVLLTNRVNPTREGTGIAELRRTIHELAARPATER